MNKFFVVSRNKTKQIKQKRKKTRAINSITAISGIEKGDPLEWDSHTVARNIYHSSLAGGTRICQQCQSGKQQAEEKPPMSCVDPFQVLRIVLLQQFGWLIQKKRNLVGFLEALACCAVLFSQCNLANATTLQ